MQDPDSLIPADSRKSQLIVPTHYLAVATGDGLWQKGNDLAKVLTTLRKRLGLKRRSLATIIVWASTCEMEAEFDVYVRVRCIHAGHPLVQMSVGGLK